MKTNSRAKPISWNIGAQVMDVQEMVAMSALILVHLSQVKSLFRNISEHNMEC